MNSAGRRTALLLLLSAIAVRPLGAEFRVGTAKADITPPIGSRMYGYGARATNVSTGVHDPLFAKALVVSDGTVEVALVTLDLGSFGADNTRRVRELVRRELDLDGVLLIASHTHSAPAFDSSFPDPDAPWLSFMEEMAARAVVEAHGRLQPARLAVGWGRVEEGHNRRNVLPDGSVEMMWGNRERLPTSPVDHSVAVVAFDSPDGAPLATLVNFACHPVVLGPENLEISADYPGAMMAMVEETTGGQAMFVQGAAGDINPFWDKTPPSEGGFEQMERMGRTLGAEVIRIRNGLVSFSQPASLSLRRETVPLEARWDLEDPDVQEKFRSLGGEALLQRYRTRFADEHEAEIDTLLVGNSLALATFPGEFFVEHGLRLKQGSMIENTLFVGYGNGALAYFPTIRAAAEGGYGGREATIVEVGAGEKLVSRALVNLHYQAGKLRLVPDL